MADIEFIKNLGCPFAQRTHLLLLEKGIPHTVNEIDLSAKPDWFVAISPYGKVPVVRHGDDVVWESAIINEYLEELYPEPAMMPRDPGRRALARFWIDFCNASFTTTWYKLLLAQEPERRARLKDRLRDHFVFMERQGIRKLGGGPFWMGRSLTLVDLTFYPWFERLHVMAHYRDFRVPDECTRLGEWARLMAARESVRTLAHPPEVFIRNAATYADGTASGTTARDMRGD